MNQTDRILITGASGMVGRALQSLLKEKGHTDVLAPSSKELNLIDQKATFEYFKTNKIRYVFHLAGRIGGIQANFENPVEFMYENAAIMMNTIMAAHEHKVEKLLNLGSSCIYPRECPQPIKEEYLLTGPLEPTNEGYALAKISGLKLCQYLNRQYGRNFISLMPCNLYGYNDHYEPKNSHVASALIYKMHKAKVENHAEVEVWGTGRPRREFLFVTDIASAIYYFMSGYDYKDLAPFINVGSGVDHSIKEIAELIRETVGFKGELKFNTTKPDGMPRKVMDVSRAENLGWRAQVPLAQGLKMAYEHYVRNL